MSAAAAPAALADPVQGEALFKQRCQLCHTEVESAAPSSANLRELDADYILQQMTDGAMAAMAAGLTDEDKAGIVAYLKQPATPPADSEG